VKEKISPTLLAIATVTRQIAQELMDTNLIIQWISTVLSCFAFFYNEKVAWILVSIGFISKLISFAINIRSQRYHHISREAQRLALLEDAYGKILDNFQVVELRRKIDANIYNKAKSESYIQPYYSSASKKGNLRLKENIQQSTFWSKNLLEIYSKKIFFKFLLSLGILGLLTYVLLVTRSSNSTGVFNPYLLSLGSLTFFLGLVDYFHIWFASTSAVKLFDEVDHRLENINIEKIEVLLANFADYGIASISAPPIPFKLYKKNHMRLKELWDERIEKLEQDKIVLPISERPAIELNDDIIPNWIQKEQFLALLFSVSGELSNRAGNYKINKIITTKIHSLSGVPVFDVQLLSSNMVFRHLILRLHDKPEEAKKELQIIKKISDESVDLVSYTPLEEPFISQGALFYYHANIQTHDQLFHIHDFIMTFINSDATDFDNYFNKMFLGFKTISIVFEKITENYSPIPLSSAIDKIYKILPPYFIIDARNDVSKVGDNTLIISTDGIYPIKDDVIFSSPFNPQSGNWFNIEFNIISTENYNDGAVGVNIKLDNKDCKILIDEPSFNKLMFEKKNQISLIFMPKKSVQTLTHFLTAEYGFSLPNFNPFNTIENLHNNQPKTGLYYAFRHRDLHCKNCLTSRSNFKVLDVADSGESMICSDIARLEISLLSYLIKELELDQIEVENILTQIENHVIIEEISQRSGIIAKLIKSIRNCFYHQFKVNPSELDIDLCYYLELCQQLNYSILSPMKLCRGTIDVVTYWNGKINKHLT